MLKRLWSYLGTGAPASVKPLGTDVSVVPGPKKKRKVEPRWNLNADETEKLLRENDQVTVLDVRTPEEYSAGHIRGARNLDFFNPQFQEKLATLDKSKPYLLHCASGHRSARARNILGKLDFKAVYHLEGGLKSWSSAGKPLVS
jgi:phage shock protein E